MTDVQEMRAMIARREHVLHAVREERVHQVETWGDQRHPDVTGSSPKQKQGARVLYESLANQYKAINDSPGTPTWDTILLEEVYEALAESDRDSIYAELIQVAAVAVAWAEDIARGE